MNLLLPAAWRLIQSGVSRKSIRVRGDSLYVNHELHGRVLNSEFVHESTGSDAQNESLVQHDNQLTFP